MSGTGDPGEGSLGAWIVAVAVQRGHLSAEHAPAAIRALAAGASAADAFGSAWARMGDETRAGLLREADALASDPVKAGTVLGSARLPEEVLRALPSRGPVDSFARTLAGRSAAIPQNPEAEPRYAVRAEHARGGMGRILVVADRMFGRTVAMKELLPGEDGEGRRERFLREAKITGMLEHPNIVPVYEIGERPEGTAYYTMKFVRGETLALRLDRIAKDPALPPNRKLAKRLKLLDALADVCRAVAYAHSKGVVNRDLKPENVMLGDFGETVVLDWGLARVKGQEDRAAAELAKRTQTWSSSPMAPARLTMDGSVIGTPAYMAPEQARGEIEEVDERSDVYALGAMLYEILTGKVPFLREKLLEMLYDVMNREPARIESLEPRAPRDLAAVARAAMVKDRASRLDSARTLESEIRAWREGRPMTLYRHSPGEQIVRFSRRNPALAATAGLLAAVLVAGTTVSVFYARESNTRAESEAKARSEALDSAGKERAAREAAEREAVRAEGERLGALSRTLIDENQGQALLVAIEASKRSPGPSARNALWEAMRRVRDVRRVFAHDFTCRDVDFSPDGRLLATCGNDYLVQIWDIATGKRTHLFEGHTREVSRVRFDAAGTRLLTASEDRTARIWSLEAGKPPVVLRRHRGPVWDAVWAEGETRLLTRGEDGAGVWRADGTLEDFKEFAKPVDQIGEWDAGVWFARSEGRVRVWSTGEVPRLLEPVDVQDVFAPREVHTAGPETRAGDGFTEVGHAGLPAAATADGRFILELAPDRTVTVRRHQGIPEPVGKLHAAPGVGLSGIHVSPDGTHAAVREDAAASLWDLRAGRLLARLNGHEYSIVNVRWSADSCYFATASADRSAVVWSVEPGRPLQRLGWSAGRPGLLDNSPDGSRALLRASDARVEVRDNRDGRLIGEAPVGSGSGAWLTPDGRFILWRRGMRFGLWDVGGSREAGTFDAAVEDAGFTISPDSSVVLVLEPGNRMTFLSVPSLSVRGRAVIPHGTQRAVAPGGRRVAIVHADARRIDVWDTEAPRELCRLVGHSGSALHASFSWDGTRVVTTAADASAQAWDVESGIRISTFRLPRIEHVRANFSPDGRWIAAWHDSAIRIADATTGREMGALPPGDRFAGCGWTSDSRAIVAHLQDGSILLYPVEPLEEALAAAPRILHGGEIQRFGVGTPEEQKAYALRWREELRPYVLDCWTEANRLMEAGDWDGAERRAARAAELLPACWYVRLGQAQYAALRAKSLEPGDPARASSVDRAMAALEKAVELGYDEPAHLRKQSWFGVVEKDPRLPALIVRMETMAR
jgi:serine/threonine protein kinase/WD40 repeat protein